MKTKRRLAKVIMILLVLFLSVIVIAVAYNVIHNRIATDDAIIRHDYETIQEKHKLIKLIARDTIEEGKGIQVNQLSRDSIRYKIYDDGEKIIIHYYIDEKINDEYPYQATITLSNDYKILDEQYSEQKSFETYKRGTQILEKMLSFLFALIALGILYFVCCIVRGVYYVVKWAVGRVKKQKSKRRNQL